MRKNDLKYKKLRLAESLDSDNAEVFWHGRCRSVVRGDEVTRLQIRRAINALRAGGRPSRESR
jgi:hypothetical protein